MRGDRQVVGVSVAWVADCKNPAYPEMPDEAEPEDIAAGKYDYVLSPAEDPCWDAEVDFAASPEWRQWHALHLPPEYQTRTAFALLQIEDRADKRLVSQRPREKGFTFFVPPSEFYTGESPRDVYRRLFRELWVRAADKYGWPPPPELPPYYQERASSRT